MSKPEPSLTPGENGNSTVSLEQSSQLLRTKLFIPPIRPNQVARSRLSNLLEGSMDRALILVSAPAGYGKTTLVSSWVKDQQIPSAWLSLDDNDNDPVRFLQYLFAALKPFAQNIDKDLPGMLQGIQPAQIENVIALLANELSSISNPFVLILDDFHVIHSEAILRILTLLLDHLPPRMHVVILTRVDPPLPLSRLRARNQLLDIRADQLRFTPDEISAFLNEAMGLRLSASDLSAMEARTEGWIAGLQLAGLSMQGCKDIHGFVSAFAGSHHYVMDYLVEEVLKLQPKNVSSFLLQTSILDRLCGSLCQAIVETDDPGSIDGQMMLESLEEMNLFLIPLDDERHWYRYHHLFADVLKKRLEHQYSHLLPELHRRASLWYERNGIMAESVQQAIAAGDQDRAAQLIENNGCFLLMSGEVATLLKWTNAIEFQSETRPWLAIQKAWAYAITGDQDRIEPTLRAPEQLLAPLEPTVEVRTLQGTIAAARAHCANSRGDTQAAAEYARRALDLLPECSSISQSIRSVSTTVLGDASWINGNLEEATRAYTDAIRIGREARNLHMVVIANSNLGDVLIEQGKLHQAADTFTNSLELAVRPDGQRSPLAGRLCAGLGRLAYERNQLDEAEKYLHQSIDLFQQWEDFENQAIGYALLARLELARGNPESAQTSARAAENMVVERPLLTRQQIQLQVELTRIWLVQGNLEKISQFIQKCDLQVEDGIPYQRAPEYVLLLRSLISRNDHEAALALADRLLKQAKAAGRMGLVIEILILQSLAFQGKKETENALVSLGQALNLARPEGYVRVFLDEGEAMTRLLCQAQAHQVGGKYSAELLTWIGKASKMPQPSMELLDEPLTAREVEVLKLIESGASNQDIARQLVISIPTVKRHITNIYTKLDVKSRTQAIAIGKQLKIFE